MAAVNFPKPTIGGVIRLVLACLVVGLLLSFFDMDPLELFIYAWDAAADILLLAPRFVNWAYPYVLAGAMVVLPLVAISWGLKVLRAQRTAKTAPPAATGAIPTTEARVNSPPTAPTPPPPQR